MKQIRDNKNYILKSIQKDSQTLIRGSIVKLKSKCGKSNCACSDDPDKRHIRFYLSYSEAGKTNMVYIPRKHLHAVEQGIQAWKSFNEASKELAKVNMDQLLREKGK
jgi:hypothetical protein